jgi:hypothetical protein
MLLPTRSIPWRRCIAAPILLAAGGALAQQAPPAAAVPADPAGAQALVDQALSPEGAAPAEGAGEDSGATTAAAPLPGASVIARWMQASACRVFTALPIDETTRFSPDHRARARLDWRVSLPKFADAHVSLTRGSAAATEASAAEQPADTAIAGAAAPDAATLAAAPTPVPGDAATATAVAAPVAAPPLTWTQKVGLVKAASPSGASASAVAGDAPAAQPTWTQKVGLVQSPSGSSGASATGVSSFKKTAKADAEKH